MPRNAYSMKDLTDLVIELGEGGEVMTDAAVDALMEALPPLFRLLAETAGYPVSQVRAVITKLRDAGRRTPPLTATSSIVPGRPQNAADGNRADRWNVPSDHKFYATKRDAQLVEIRYYLQVLSMLGAPPILSTRAPTAFNWLLGHELRPGEYKDPIMLRDISFPEFIVKPRRVQSGHYIPLARGGRHTYDNTFLMLSRSNAMQSDLT